MPPCTLPPQLHFVEKHIDYNYKWNTWDLRRKAIQYANLRKAKTTSMQTNSSHFRAAAASQVWLPKEHGTQTGISKGTNPIRDHNYLTASVTRTHAYTWTCITFYGIGLSPPRAISHPKQPAYTQMHTHT